MLLSAVQSAMHHLDSVNSVTPTEFGARRYHTSRRGSMLEARFWQCLPAPSSLAPVRVGVLTLQHGLTVGKKEEILHGHHGDHTIQASPVYFIDPEAQSVSPSHLDGLSDMIQVEVREYAVAFCQARLRCSKASHSMNRSNQQHSKVACRRRRYTESAHDAIRRRASEIRDGNGLGGDIYQDHQRAVNH